MAAWLWQRCAPHARCQHRGRHALAVRAERDLCQLAVLGAHAAQVAPQQGRQLQQRHLCAVADAALDACEREHGDGGRGDLELETQRQGHHQSLCVDFTAIAVPVLFAVASGASRHADLVPDVLHD